MKQIGFSSGVSHKMIESFSEENMHMFKDCGCNALEINCHSVADADNLDIILPMIEGFDYLSVHLPCDITYKNDEETRCLLKKIENFYMKSGARLAVVHPDIVENWNVFRNSFVNWAIENMDNRKSCYKDAADLKKFFEEQKTWNLVLDLGHCNNNDRTMALAGNLINIFRNRIKEIHLSGYKTFHDPLYRTEQIEIIGYCNKLNVPIIIESTFDVSDGIGGIRKEFAYVMANLRRLSKTISQ